MVSPSNDLDELVEKETKQLRLHRGWFKWIYWRIRQWFSVGPRAEIAHDWQVVNQFAERARHNLTLQGNVSGKQKHDLVKVLALLNCARTETDFAQAWTYLNSADAMLPLIVSADELKACMTRLESADRRLPDEFQERLAEQLKKLSAAIAKAFGASTATDKHRNVLHAAQLTRSLLWNSLNRQVSLKLSLWRSISVRLIIALLALFGAVAMHATPFTNPVWKVLAPFVEIALLGFFGGMLSAFLTARDAEVNVPSYEVLRARASLRMLLGGAGALVVYSIGLWLFSEKLKATIEGSIVAFMSVGIVAGFSERLFIDTLEKAGRNLHLSGSPTKPEEKTKPAKKPAPGKKAADKVSP